MKYCENFVRGLPSRLIQQYLQGRSLPLTLREIMLCHCSHYLHSLLIVHLIWLPFSAQLWIIKKSHSTRFNQILDNICHLLVSLTKNTPNTLSLFPSRDVTRQFWHVQRASFILSLFQMKWVVRKANGDNCQNDLQPHFHCWCHPYEF